MLKRIFPAKFQLRRENAQTATSRLEELEEQLRLTRVATEINIEGPTAEAYFRLRDDFAAVCKCNRIWDTLSRKAVDRFRERSAASEAITRAPVDFSLESSELIDWEHRVPLLRNKVGGDMYVYPGFVLYRASGELFALIDFADISLDFKPVRFIENEVCPSDSKVVDHAWEKSNKDGSPDRRFANNRQFPVLLYGQLILTSPEGLNEEYQFSNPEPIITFCQSWQSLHQALTQDHP